MTNREPWAVVKERLLSSGKTDFASLVKLASLDPARHMRFAEWSGVDFGGSDLHGFDFTGAKLIGCNFEGALIEGARFDQALIDEVQPAAKLDSSGANRFRVAGALLKEDLWTDTAGAETDLASLSVRTGRSEPVPGEVRLAFDLNCPDVVTDGLTVGVKQGVLTFRCGDGHTTEMRARRGYPDGVEFNGAKFTPLSVSKNEPSWLVTATGAAAIGLVADAPEDFIRIMNLTPGAIVSVDFTARVSDISTTFVLPDGHMQSAAKQKIKKRLRELNLLGGEEGIVKLAAAEIRFAENRTNLRAAADWEKHAKNWKRADKPAPEHLPPGAVFQDAPCAPEMVVVPPGRFMMGSKDDEGCTGERPQHEVTIPHAFAVGRFPVTFEEWDAAYTTDGVSHRPGDGGWGRGHRPVIHVSWEDAQAYVKWLCVKTGKPYRLLSEAEWEYVCRAGTETAYSFGESISKVQAQFSEDKWGSAGSTAEVGSFSANDFGLYGMHGNVTEWCEDRWHEGYARKPEDLKQTGGAWTAGKSNYRVLRGGLSGNDAQILRAGYRISSLPGFRFSYVGFRVARTLLAS